MRLSLLTYNLGKDFSLDKLIEVSEKCGYDGLEFRAGVGPHGVELTATPEQRAAIKARMAARRVAIAGIGTGCRYESLDAAERRRQVEETKAYLDLARDVGAPRIRVFGNAFPKGADRDAVVKNVGDCLREGAAAAEFAPRTAEQDDGQLVGVMIAVEHARTVHHRRVVEQRAVALFDFGHPLAEVG